MAKNKRLNLIACWKMLNIGLSMKTYYIRLGMGDGSQGAIS